MNHSIIDKILAEDAAFQKDKVGTFCSECKRNTSVGFYPQLHVMRRTLCYNCAVSYYKLLTSLGFMEEPTSPLPPKPRPKVFRRRFPLRRKSVHTPPARWRNQPPVIEVPLEPRYSSFANSGACYSSERLMEPLNLPPENRIYALHELQKLVEGRPGYRLAIEAHEGGAVIKARITRPARIPARLSPKLRRALGWEPSPHQ